MLTIFTTGLLTGLALIAAIGAQGAFVLRQGIRGEHIGTVVGLCILFDVALISLGIGGVGAFISSNAALLGALKYGGASYLLYYAYTSFRSAMNPQGLNALSASGGSSGATGALVGETPGRSRGSVAIATAAITLLNPHVYLDAVLMLGNLGNQFPGSGRWMFGAGALLASVIWFCSIGFGAKRMAPFLAKESVWRGVDLGVGLLMIGIAGKLVFGH